MARPFWKTSQHAAAAALAATLAVFAPASAQTADPAADPESGSGFSPSPTIYGESYMVAAANPLAAEAAAKILAEGGSAADAAIAALMVLNVVEPQSSGVGGGGFALYWNAETRRLTSWDGRETAPLLATPTLFLSPEGEPLDFWDAVAGGISVGAPGLVRMLAEIHERQGALEWEDLFEDAIRLAEEGFEVSPRLATLLAENAERLAADPTARRVFFGEDGKTLPEGALLRNPELAETLREIAEDGPDAFYEGGIADAIVVRVAEEPLPGALSQEDLAAYRALPRKPVCMLYRDRFEVCGMGPPSSGGVTVGMILGVLNQFPMDAYGAEDPLAAHVFLLASQLAYADRAVYLADPDYVSQPTLGLLDPAYLLLRSQAIDLRRAPDGPASAGNPPWREGALRFAPDPSLGRPGTTHVTIVDADGDIISVTASVETAFGSGRMAAGFILNNQLTDFSFRPEIDGLQVANAPGPRKRPRSSMAPTIVFDVSGEERRPVLALGSPGGSRIIEYVARSIVAVLDWKMTPADAVTIAHISERNIGAAQIEERPDADALAEALATLGWEVRRSAMTSGIHMIAIGADGSLAGAADPRREGVVRAD